MHINEDLLLELSFRINLDEGAVKMPSVWIILAVVQEAM